MLPLLATPLVGTVEVGERTEVRARDSGSGIRTDAEEGFRFRFGVHGRRVEFTFATTPRFTAFSWTDSQRALLASAPGQIGLGYRERHFGIFVSGDGSYGLENYATLRYPTAGALPGTPPGQPVTPQPLTTLPADSISYASARGALSAYQIPTSRWVVTEAAAYEASGGTTQTSRRFVPFQYGPRAALSFDYRVTRIDHVGASADASFSHFSTGADIGLASVVVRYVRDVARGTAVAIGGGATGAAFRVDPAPFRFIPYGNAEITIAHHRGFLGHRLDLDGALRFAPAIDRIAGVVDPRVTAVIGATYTTNGFVIRLASSLIQSVLVGSPASVTVFGGEGVLTIPLTRNVAFDGGVRLAIQSFQGTSLGTYSAFLGLDVHPDVLHFRTR